MKQLHSLLNASLSGTSEDDNRRKLKIIQDEASRPELMLTDVRDFTRPSRPQKELQDINSIIENTLALLKNDFKDKGISCEKSLDSDIPLIFFDPWQKVTIILPINEEETPT
jgi:signal transduction histidine kinase